MPRPKTTGRDRKPRKRATGAKTKRNSAASSQATTPSDVNPAAMTVEDLIRDLEEDRQLARSQNRGGAAVNASVTIARLMHMLPHKFGRPPSSPRKPGDSPAPPAKFDGNYNEAARRIALLLRLGAKEKAEEADKAETANGQKRDRHS